MSEQSKDKIYHTPSCRERSNIERVSWEIPLCGNALKIVLKGKLLSLSFTKNSKDSMNLWYFLG